MGRKMNSGEMPKVNEELSGFHVGINQFGEITTSYDIDKLNTFLDKNVEDKKFKEVEDFKRNISSPEKEDSLFD
ncbi:MAG: hypothetical protein EBS07_10560 [Sphingobacteriia bacterium]|nr:hypothetical protein [Sphingobacteriia bacterium]